MESEVGFLAMRRIYQVDKTVRLAGCSEHKRDDTSRIPEERRKHDHQGGTHDPRRSRKHAGRRRHAPEPGPQGPARRRPRRRPAVLDARAQKRELLRRLQERNAKRADAPAEEAQARE
ncbi:hypothetical protein GCM10020295_59880 [Streptomyces cinereospinus]